MRKSNCLQSREREKFHHLTIYKLTITAICYGQEVFMKNKVKTMTKRHIKLVYFAGISNAVESDYNKNQKHHTYNGQIDVP